MRQLLMCGSMRSKEDSEGSRLSHNCDLFERALLIDLLAPLLKKSPMVTTVLDVAASKMRRLHIHTARLPSE